MEMKALSSNAFEDQTVEQKFDAYDPRSELKKVCVLYTGGTIGMKKSPDGYIPVKGYMEDRLLQDPQFHDPNLKAPTTKYGNRLLCTPPCRFGKQTLYEIIEFPNLIDSSNMQIENWLMIASELEKYYGEYDAFVVLHGTDTMAYTASVLSFMLENLRKTVMVTGSQVPLSQSQNDGNVNLLGALTVCGNYEIPEVCLFFDHKVFRGNRTIKQDADSFGGFNSPNFLPLAEMGIEAQIQWERIRVPRLDQNPVFHKNLCGDVTVLRVYPGLNSNILAHQCGPPVRGIVLQTYGAGNGPDADKNFLRVLREATDRGVIIINVTQCMQGKVAAHYAAGSALVKAGCIPGADMTCEAALTKLSYLLAREDLQGPENLPRLRTLAGSNLRGEMTESQGQRLTWKDNTFVASVASALKTSSAQDMKAISASLSPVLLCTFASKGDIPAVEEWVKPFDASAQALALNAGDYDGRTPLHLAAGEAQLEMAKHLMRNGARINCEDRWHHTPLHDALVSKEETGPIIDFLVRNGGVAHNVGDLLCEAGSKGDLKLIERLGMAAADFSLGDYDDRTALHLAVSNGNVEAAKKILELGGPKLILKVDRWGNTALEDAQVNKRTELAALLSSTIKKEGLELNKSPLSPYRKEKQSGEFSFGTPSKQKLKMDQ